MSKPIKILFKYPSRGRPKKFFRGLDSIYNNLADRVNFHVSCTLDYDDAKMFDDIDVGYGLLPYDNLSVNWGYSKSKIHAINRDMPDLSDYSIIICMSDDMLFTMYGFDEDIRINMQNVFPGFDGLLNYKDKDTNGTLATLYVAGINWYKRRGHIYHPSYISLWADNEEQDCAVLASKYQFIDTLIYWHANPAYYPDQGRDQQFNTQQSEEVWTHDEANYNKRKLLNFKI